MSSSAPRPLAEGSRWSSASRWLPAALCFFVTLAAVGPLFADPGFLTTRGIGDSPNLLFRVHQWLASSAGGQFPARWMPDAAYGYGLPYFSYYASFSTQVAALLKLYGFSFVLAVKLAQALALLTGAAGFYGWRRASGAGRPAASLAAAAYTFAPFHLVNLYVRGDSLAELWAMGLFPVLLWAAQRVLTLPSLGRAFTLAAAVATLACTHNISALNFLPFLGAYVVLGGAGRGWRPLGVSLAALAWGLALSAFFWLPALREGAFVQLGDLTQGYFFYGNHFRGADLMQWTPVFDYAAAPFSMGLLQTLGAAAGALVLLARAARRRRWVWTDTFVLGGLVVATLMITPWSRPLWDTVPLLGYTQFPWRFLSIQAVFTAALAAALVDGEPAAPRRAWRWPAALALAALLALAGLGGLRLQFVPLADAEVTAARLNLYEYFTTALGNTVNAEYLPDAVVPRPFTSDALLGRAPRLKALTGAAAGERLTRTGARETWRITVAGDQPAAVAVPTYWWPGWQAEIDGQPSATRAADGLGWISFELTPGTHTVALWLSWTPLRAGAEAFSAAALVVPLAALAVWRRRWPRPPARLGLWAALLGVAALGSFGLHRLPSAAAASAPLNLDFDLLAYPHRDVVRFADGTRLVRAEPAAEQAARGETLTLHTEWELTRPVTATFTLALPLQSAVEPATTAQVAFTPDAAGRARFDVALPLSPQLRPGLYFVSVQLLGDEGSEPAVTAQGQRRGLVHLAPVVIDDDGALTTPVASYWPDLGGAVRVLAAEAAAEAAPAAGAAVRVAVTWQALTDLPRNYQVALRLTDAAGNEWGRGGDVQAGAGFYPTALWRPGEVVTDQYRLPLSTPGEPPGTYTTTVTVYDASALQPVGEFSLATVFDRYDPRAGHAALFDLTPDLAVEKVEAPAEVAQGQTLAVRVHWLTGAAPTSAYHARWSLTSDAGVRFTQVLALAPGSPANAWPAEAWLIGRAGLKVPNDLAPDQYTLTLQLVTDGDRPIGPEVAVGTVTVTGRERVFTVPPLQTPLVATFDGQLQLWGYEALLTSARLQLTLAWGALAAPRGDYKYFVHVFDPAVDAIVTQADAMPRAFTYPTSQWAAGEVVTETVTLSLTDVPPGRYAVAVGWYDPAAPDLARLPAFDAQGAPLPLERVLLPLTVTVGE